MAQTDTLASSLQSTAEVPYIPPLSSISPISAKDLPAPSSIEKSGKAVEPLPLSGKPELDPPSPNIWGFVQVTLEAEKIASDFIRLDQINMEKHFGEIREWEKKQLIKINESAEHAQSWNFWNFLRDIASLIVAAFSTIIGFFVVTSVGSALVGGALIASGVLAITNFIFQHTDTWDWIAKQIAEEEQTQQKLKSIMPLVVSVISTTIGIAGSIGAAFFDSLNLTQKLLSIGQTAANFAQGVTTIAGGISGARMKWTEADLRSIKSETQFLKYQIENCLTRMQEFFDSQKQTVENSSELIRMTLNTWRTICG